jgi:hypothetical protein
MARPARRVGERGTSLLILLIAVAAILVAVALMLGMHRRSTRPEVPATPQETLAKAGAAACLSNRSVARAYYTNWKIEHPDEEPDLSILPPGTRCPGGGEYSWSSDGILLCSLH